MSYTPPPMTAPVGGGNFEKHLIPAGTYPARCVWLINVGTQELNWQGEIKKQVKLIIGYELPTEQLPSDHPRAGEPCFISERFTFSFHEKAGLRHHIDAWRGKAMTDAEYGTFDIGKMLGAPAVLSIVHAEKEGKTYANISSISPEASMRKLVPDFKVPAQVNDSLYFNVGWLTTKDGAEYAMKAFNAMPKYYQELVQKSPEWQAYTKSAHYIAPVAPVAAPAATPEAAPAPVDDDSLPF